MLDADLIYFAIRATYVLHRDTDYVELRFMRNLGSWHA